MCLWVSFASQTKKILSGKIFKTFLCCLLKYFSAAASAKRCALLSVEQRIFILKEKKFFTRCWCFCLCPQVFFKQLKIRSHSLSFSFTKEAWKVFNSFQVVSRSSLRSTNNNNSLVKMFIEHSRLSSFLFLEFTVHNVDNENDDDEDEEEVEEENVKL